MAVLTASVPSAAVLPVERPRPAASMLILDPIGSVFDRVRTLELPAALSRITTARSVSSELSVKLTVCASYGAVNWDDVEQLRHHAPTVIVTTAYRSDEAHEALQRNLAGYLDAELRHEALDRALRGALLHDEPGFTREVIGIWIRANRLQNGNGHEHMAGLTPRQEEIMDLVARGATDKEIAAALGIAQATAQKHVTNILQRLHVPNRAAAVAVVAAHRRFA